MLPTKAGWGFNAQVCPSIKPKGPTPLHHLTEQCRPKLPAQCSTPLPQKTAEQGQLSTSTSGDVVTPWPDEECCRSSKDSAWVCCPSSQQQGHMHITHKKEALTKLMPKTRKVVGHPPGRELWWGEGGLKGLVCVSFHSSILWLVDPCLRAHFPEPRT